MPTFLVTDPATGRQVRLTGDSPPTEAELEQIFSNLPSQQAAAQPQDPRIPLQDLILRQGGGELGLQGQITALREKLNVPDTDRVVQAQPTIGQRAVGALENVAALGSGIVSEPLAGLRGIGAAIASPVREALGFDPVSPTKIIEETRGAATFQPRTETGQRQQEKIGEALAPVGEAISGAEKFLGDEAFELTGSPAIAAAATALPAAALELIGIKGSQKFVRGAKIPPTKQVSAALVESAPEIDKLKQVSRQVYNEIDNSGVRIKQASFDNLINKIEKVTKSKGLDPRVTDKAAGALEALKDSKGVNQTLGEVDTLRNIAQGVANNIDSTEKALGNIMISEIDGFLDTLKAKDLIKGTEKAAETGKKFRAARKLWGRARRSELIQEALKEAKLSASGFENGIRKELNKITRNKKLRKFFPEKELQAIRGVIEGDFKQNFAKLIGRFGFSEGRATNVLTSLGGVGLGGVAGGGVGAFVVPAVGTVSRKISQKLTLNKAKFADAIIRAGADGERIAKAYLSSVPKAKRSVADLADLLSDPNINITDLEFISNQTIKEAAEIAKGRRAIAASAGLAATTGALTAADQQANQQ